MKKEVPTNNKVLGVLILDKKDHFRKWLEMANISKRIISIYVRDIERISKGYGEYYNKEINIYKISNYQEIEILKADYLSIDMFSEKNFKAHNRYSSALSNYIDFLKEYEEYEEYEKNLIFYKCKDDIQHFDFNYPCVVLIESEWDDYHYRTSFNLIYYPSKDARVDIGEVKILRNKYEVFSEDPSLSHKRYTKLHLDESFTELNKNFCSLGQDLNYYKLLKQQGEVGKEILLRLNDVVLNPDILDNFLEIGGFSTSLIRFSNAEKAFHEAKQYFGEEIEKIYVFTFSSRLDNATRPHNVSFDFKHDSSLPFRMNVLIGKNGTGKTQIMARLANALSGYKVENQGEFIPSRRPSFGEVIAVSYSVFDEFERPLETETKYSYKYCGLRDSKGNIYSKEQLSRKFLESFGKIKGTPKEKLWKDILEVVIEPEHRNILEQLKQENTDVNMSSGQRILVTIITEVIENIQPDSILLIDEPELHLHPNAISNLYRMLYKLLESFKSFAIISTHSPIIVQETPTRYINVFERIENTPMVNRLEIESFGENLSTITDKIFSVSDEESYYKHWLRELSKCGDFEAVLSKFEDKLSLNAMAYLSTLIKENKEQKKYD